MFFHEASIFLVACIFFESVDTFDALELVDVADPILLVSLDQFDFIGMDNPGSLGGGGFGSLCAGPGAAGEISLSSGTAINDELGETAPPEAPVCRDGGGLAGFDVFDTGGGSPVLPPAPPTLLPVVCDGARAAAGAAGPAAPPLGGHSGGPVSASASLSESLGGGSKYTVIGDGGSSAGPRTLR